MAANFSLDKHRIRQAFSKAAKQYDQAAVLQFEVGQRLLQRLDYVKLKPQRILDVGCGTGRLTAGLLQRYPDAEVVALDFAFPMLQHARQHHLQTMHDTQIVCGDLDQLPFAEKSIDLIFSSMTLQWSHQMASAFHQIQRVLKPNGLLMFATLGPDTLFELRQSWSQVDENPHVHTFIDMHDYGDMLVNSGFAEPVMDMEYITMTYPNVRQLMQDLRMIGASNAAVERPTGLLGRRQLHTLHNAYEKYRDTQKRLPATYEVIYGHAWGSTQPQSGSSEARFSIENIGRR